MLYEAPQAHIKTMCYNIAGVSPAQTAKELETAVRKFIPDADITYKPDKVAMELMQSIPIKVLDDTRAREEWGWQPQYTDYEKVVEDFIREVKTLPGYYGLT